MKNLSLYIAYGCYIPLDRTWSTPIDIIIWTEYLEPNGCCQLSKKILIFYCSTYSLLIVGKIHSKEIVLKQLSKDNNQYYNLIIKFVNV